jgi:hypothetical protein
MLDAAPQIDREAGIIRGVKVLGRESRNGRTYSDQALSDAAGMSDGAPVNLNHPSPDQMGRDRAVHDGIGWLVNPTVQRDGVYADMHVLKSHPMAGALFESAERNPNRFGLSINADGKVSESAGRKIVDRVEKLRSVDVVQCPATNAGLFESVHDNRIAPPHDIEFPYVESDDGMDEEIATIMGDDSLSNGEKAKRLDALTQRRDELKRAGEELPRVLRSPAELARAVDANRKEFVSGTGSPRGPAGPDGLGALGAPAPGTRGGENVGRGTGSPSSSARSSDKFSAALWKYNPGSGKPSGDSAAGPGAGEAGKARQRVGIRDSFIDALNSPNDVPLLEHAQQAARRPTSPVDGIKLPENSEALARAIR